MGARALPRVATAYTGAVAEVEGEVREDEGLDAEAEARRRLALAQIRQYPDPALRLTANPVEEFDDDLRRLAERMIDLMRDARGVGLAATQVGILRRLFVFDPGEDDARVIVNPVIAERGNTTETDDEGCLSLQDVRVPVERATRVTIAGQDADRADVSWELEGLAARVVQHELDHLDGVLIIDRTDIESRKRALGILRPQPILAP
jgi:peptide deformylase